MDANAINSFLWKVIITSGGGFLTIVGLLSLLVWRKQIFSIFSGSDHEPSPHRHNRDELSERFMTAYERNTEAFVSTAQAQGRMVEVLNDLREQMRAVNIRLDRLAEKV